jgi:hypothetical protein
VSSLHNQFGKLRRDGIQPTLSCTFTGLTGPDLTVFDRSHEQADSTAAPLALLFTRGPGLDLLAARVHRSQVGGSGLQATLFRLVAQAASLLRPRARRVESTAR